MSMVAKILKKKRYEQPLVNTASAPELGTA